MRMTDRRGSVRRGPCRGGFTLIELLVVIAIIALLIGILLPALGRARDAGRLMLCLSNNRQLVMSLTQYAQDFRGEFPPNISPIPGSDQRLWGQYWYDVPRLGPYLPQIVFVDRPANAFETIAGGVMQCPNHTLGSRSYTINHFAQSVVGSGAEVFNAGRRPRPSAFGRRDLWFNLGGDFPDRLLLIAEMWAAQPIFGDQLGGWRFVTLSSMGVNGRPGERFGAGSGVVGEASISPIFATAPGGGNSPPPPEFGPDGLGPPTSYLPYNRHPRRLDDTATAIRGAAVIGFLDGHSALHNVDDLIDRSTQRSTFRVLWSPRDFSIERPAP